MAGAMRRMGVYLGLVEDDDTRGGYDRYAARQSDYDGDFDRADRGYDRGYDRYAAADHDEPVADDRYGYAGGYGASGYDTDYPVDERAEARIEERAPEADVSLGRRPAATPRTLGPAPSTGSSAARLAELAARVRAAHPGASELSAGMSADLEAAVTAGATVVRVGTALFGARALSSEPDV